MYSTNCQKSIKYYLNKQSIITCPSDKGYGYRERFKNDKKINVINKPHINNPQYQTNNCSTSSSQNVYKCPAEYNCPYETQSELGCQSLKDEHQFSNDTPDLRKEPTIRKINFNLKSNDSLNNISSFKLARIQSANCLGNLSQKLYIELQNIDQKIYNLKNELIQNLHCSFENVRKQICNVMAKVFEQTEQKIRLRIQQHSQTLSSELIQTKTALAEQYYKIEEMKQDINKDDWRKVAGELLSNQIEDRVEKILQRSRAIQLNHIKINDVEDSNFTALQQILKNIIQRHVLEICNK